MTPPPKPPSSRLTRSGRTADGGGLKGVTQSVLGSIWVALLLPLITDLPPLGKSLAGAAALVAFALAYPGARKNAVQLVNRLRGIYSVLFMTIIVIAGLALFVVPRVLPSLIPVSPKAVPSSVRNARNVVVDIQAAKTAGELQRSTASPPGSETYWRRNYEIVMVENAPPVNSVLREYSADGRKVAVELVRGDGIVRQYYDRRTGCHFASDFFNEDGQQLVLEYRRGCKGPFTRVQRDSPFFIPIAPGLGYSP